MLADKVGSTAALLNFAKEDAATQFIVATESGILHQMQKDCPSKQFIPAPPEEAGCACNECSFMKLNTLEKLARCLADEQPEINVPTETANRARRSIDRMLELSK